MIINRGAGPDGNTTAIGRKVNLLRKQISLLDEHEELLDKYVYLLHLKINKK